MEGHHHWSDCLRTDGSRGCVVCPANAEQRALVRLGDRRWRHMLRHHLRTAHWFGHEFRDGSDYQPQESFRLADFGQHPAVGVWRLQFSQQPHEAHARQRQDEGYIPVQRHHGFLAYVFKSAHHPAVHRHVRTIQVCHTRPPRRDGQRLPGHLLRLPAVVVRPDMAH